MMRDREMERLFERVGNEARPDAEFEEDLLLRLEAGLADQDVDETAEMRPPPRLPNHAPVIELDLVADLRQQRRRPVNRVLTLAAAVVVLVGIVGLTLAVRDPAQDSPVITAPPTLPVTSPPSLDSSVGALCARHADELARVDDLGSPLSNAMVTPEDDEREQLLNELVVVVDDYRTILTAAESVEPSILDELAAIDADLVNELAFASRGRLDGARYAIPTIVDRLLAINVRLAEAGASCG